MPTCGRSKLTVVGVLCALFPALALAVERAPDEFGQVLIYPYYTVRGSGKQAFNTLFTIGNSTDHIKAVRLRIHESREGAPVGDFNIYLDANDSWTGAILATAEGAGIATNDTSCTYPAISRTAASPTLFTNATYANESGDVSLDRTREGYFEVIEMGDYGSATPAGSVAAGVHHSGTASLPANCGVAQTDTGEQALPPTGRLFGSALLISTQSGLDYYYAATALSHFTDQKAGGWGTPEPSSPTLANAHPATSSVTDDLGRSVISQWAQGIDSVSAVLMTRQFKGEFVLDSNTASGTDWVVALPTKWYYAHTGLAPTAPFRDSYDTSNGCEQSVVLQRSNVIFDRESYVQKPNIGFPGQPGPPVAQICGATQLITFNSSLVFQPYSHSDGTYTYVAVTNVATSFQNGWMSLPFDSLVNPGSVAVAEDSTQHRLVAGATTIIGVDGNATNTPNSTYFGLPAVGFGVSVYFNGVLQVGTAQPLLSTYIGGTTLSRAAHVE